MSSRDTPATSLFRIYDDATLAHWAQRYPPNIRWNYEELLLANMTREEKLALRGVGLSFPELPPDEMAGTPFVFFATTHPSQITIPVFSVKFLDDLSIAAAYLEVHGFSLETIFDYMALLKYGSPDRCAGGVLPPPLTALQIPDDVLDNKRVDDLAQKILKSTLVWVLAHEAGHVRYGHGGYAGISRREAQRNEMQADEFATELFRRAGVMPAGMVQLFMMLAHVSAHRGDYGSASDWQESVAEHTHPLSMDRLKVMADRFRESPGDFVATEPLPNPESVLFIADEIEKITRIVEEPALQRFIRLRGLTVTPESLGPRPLSDPFAALRARVGSQHSGEPFDGLYEGKCARQLEGGGEETLDVCMLIDQAGSQARGRFSFGFGEGSLNGTVAEDVFTYEWEFAGVIGRGELRRDSDGGLEGDWGYDHEYQGGGHWTVDPASMPDMGAAA